MTSDFGFDLANRLTSIQHAADATTLFAVEYGYDAVGNRRFTRNLTPGLEDRSERYAYDERHRLRGMERGEITAGDSPTLDTPLADADLPAAQEWTDLDRRGNWLAFSQTVGSGQGGPASRR